MNAKIVERITDLVRDFYRSGKNMTAPELIDLRRRLASLKYAFALEVSAYLQDRNDTEFRRKSKFARIRKEVIDGGESAAKAEIKAHAECNEELKAESGADAVYRSAALIFDSVKDVLDAIGQQVANMRQERMEEMRGTGSQP